jgi:hypothetical protein
MPIIDKNRIYDGFDSMEGGVDAGRRPNVIGPNQAYSADNVSFRGGIPRSRPGIRKPAQNFTNRLYYLPSGFGPPTGTGTSGLDTETRFKKGIFQCACYFSPHLDEEYLLALIDGRFFRLTPRDYSVDIQEIPIPDKQNRGNQPKGFIIQADKWAIAQDGESTPILYDGVLARRAGADEVPTGEIMAYGMGRIVVARNGQEVVFGDLYGSHEGSDAADSIIKFTETTFLLEGFPASIPFSLGKITAVCFFPQLDTSTGTGQLFVFTDRGACGFDMSKPREEWKTSAFQQVTLASTGVRGWRSVVALNEDLWFRASDGARTFRQARSEARGYTHIPLSTNVKQWLEKDTSELLDFASATTFDNRFILTCSPIWNHGRPYHNGLLSLDFDVLSSFGTNARPAWDGHWTKLKATQLVSGIFRGRRRAFVFGLGDNYENTLYEITDDRDDFDGPINSELVSRSFDFSRDQASNPFSEKEIYSGDVWLSNISDHDATFRAYYRPDGYNDWLDWGEAIAMDITGEWQEITEGMEPTMRPGFAPRRTIEKPEKLIDPMTKRQLTRGFEFQVKLNWTGYLELLRFRLHSQLMTENSRATNP